MQPTNDRIVLRQSWLGELAMCPERARQSMLGISQDTQSTSTMLGTAVHYGIEQCLIEVMETGKPLTRAKTLTTATKFWDDHRDEIVRWNHKEDEPVEIIKANIGVWWDEVRQNVRPTAVEWTTSQRYGSRERLTVCRSFRNQSLTGRTRAASHLPSGKRSGGLCRPQRTLGR